MPQTPSAHGTDRNDETLLGLMKQGDRDAGAEFIERHGDLIRRRIGHKLGAPMRRLYDSTEVMSSVARRVDRTILEQRLRAESLGELWSLLFRIAENAIVDRGRIWQALSRAEQADGQFAAHLRACLEREPAEDFGVELKFDEIVRQLHEPVDRQILALWARGVPHASIADDVGMSAQAVRKRWQRIKTELRATLIEGESS